MEFLIIYHLRSVYFCYAMMDLPAKEIIILSYTPFYLLNYGDIHSVYSPEHSVLRHDPHFYMICHFLIC